MNDQRRAFRSAVFVCAAGGLGYQGVMDIRLFRRSPLAWSAAAFLLALRGDAPATAQTGRLALSSPSGLAGRVILSGCRQGQCSWLRVTGSERLSANAHGELRRVTGRHGTSVHGDRALPSRYGPRLRIEWEPAERSDYVFCSRERPAYAFADEAGHIAHYLDLFDLAGYQYSSASMYMRLCHDRALPSGTATLRRLGYRGGTRNEQVENARPEDLARF
jgi:hypothetical protein